MNQKADTKYNGLNNKLNIMEFFNGYLGANLKLGSKLKKEDSLITLRYKDQSYSFLYYPETVDFNESLYSYEKFNLNGNWTRYKSYSSYTINNLLAGISFIVRTFRKGFYILDKNGHKRPFNRVLGSVKKEDLLRAFEVITKDLEIETISLHDLSLNTDENLASV